jgi:signal transduction histidine kinase
MLKHFLDLIDRVVEYDAVSIHTLQENVLEVLSYKFNDKIGVPPPRELFFEEIPGFQEMIELQKGFVLTDLQKEPELMAAIIGMSEQGFTSIPPSVRSYMAAPMVIKNQGVGMLALSSAQPDVYGQDELNLIQTLANQVAVAIENAHLFEEAQKAAVSEERIRFARDLHDSTTQSLYSALLFSETGKKLTEKGDLEEAAYYQSRVSDVVHDALKEMRLLVFEMRPPMLEKEGLVGALQMRLDAVESRSGIEARFYADDLPSLPAKTSESLYYILQESLNNSLKHAEADNVSVKFNVVDKTLIVEILDDGQGFDLEGAAQSGGMGLVNMGDRTKKIGGELKIESNPGEGTMVVVQIPMEKLN